MRGAGGVEVDRAVGRQLDAIGERRGDVDERAPGRLLGRPVAGANDQVAGESTRLRSRVTTRANAERTRVGRGGDDTGMGRALGRALRTGRVGEREGSSGPIGISRAPNRGTSILGRAEEIDDMACVP